eukprot:gene23969-60926_t
MRYPHTPCVTGVVDNTRALNVSEGHFVDRWPAHVVPFAEDLWRETRNGRMLVRMRAEGSRGFALADAAARAARTRAHVDHRSVLVHPRGNVHIWLADARSLAIVPDPRDEVMRRLAIPPQPYLWNHVDDELTQQMRDRAMGGGGGSLFADGCLSGMQLGALRPRGAALLGTGTFECPVCHFRNVPFHHPYTACDSTLPQRRQMMRAFAADVARLSRADADVFHTEARTPSSRPGAHGPKRPALGIRWKGLAILLLTPEQSEAEELARRAATKHTAPVAALAVAAVAK